jgi:phosphopantetheinyl transferase (holo-ACP synthase)
MKLIENNYKIIYEELNIKNIHVSISHEDDFSIA